MTFRLYSGEEFCELIIRDGTGAKIEIFKWNLKDKSIERKIFNIIQQKYGVFRKRDSDLSWVKDTS